MEVPKIDAKVSSLREILTELSDIDVPWYQRTYKWENSQVDDIFHDVVFYAWDAGRSGAFLGSIVFAPGEKAGAWEIIDGQQRITTLTVLLSVLAHSLMDYAPTSPKIGEVFMLLHRKDGTPKLQPKELDFVIYTEIVSKYRKGFCRNTNKVIRVLLLFLRKVFSSRPMKACRSWSITQFLQLVGNEASKDRKQRNSSFMLYLTRFAWCGSLLPTTRMASRSSSP